LTGRTSKKPLRIVNRIIRSRLSITIFLCAAVIFSAYLLTPEEPLQIVDLKTGEKVWEDIRADYDITILDELTTNKRRKNAEESVLPVYDYDSRMEQKLHQKMTEAMNEWRQIMRERRMKSVLDTIPQALGPQLPLNLVSPEPTQKMLDNLEADYQKFTTETSLKISPETFRLLKEFEFSLSVEEAVQSIITHIASFSIVNERESLLETAPNGFMRRDIYTHIERVIFNLDTIISLEMAYREIDDVSERLVSENRLITDIAAEMAGALIVPNLVLNREETRNRQQMARDSVNPVYIHVAAGEIIIEAGDVVTPDIKLRLDRLSEAGHSTRFSFVFAGNVLFLMVIGYIVILDIKKFHQNLDSEKRFLLVLIFILFLSITKFFFNITEMIPDYLAANAYDSVYTYRFAVPYAFGCMLIALLLNIRLAILFSFIFGLTASLIADKNLTFGLYALFSGYSAIFAVSRYKQRTMILQGGFLISMANVFFILILFFLEGKSNLLAFAFSALMGICSGLLVAMIVMILLPVLEWLFKIPTDLRLLELSNFNEPLLRRQAMEAPGTHHHSLMVADLAEAAAEAIGANSLLAKVAAYYHDIGKIMQPQYFIENIRGKNPHEKLTPNMSVMIIRKHVKDGVELTRQAGLGKDIVDIVQQHHGNSLISFFHFKACENVKTGDANPVQEENFRYNGPRPRSREAAIVLIADSVEAAARSMKNPSPSSLKLMVNKITSAKFSDHQFDECELTFRELTIIAETLYSRLLRNNHTRIEYPGFNFTDDMNQKKSNTAETQGRRNKPEKTVT
jgi:cyclic-di-AMP phosphodiesterase PgpH